MFFLVLTVHVMNKKERKVIDFTQRCNTAMIHLKIFKVKVSTSVYTKDLNSSMFTYKTDAIHISINSVTRFTHEFFHSPFMT